MRPGLRLGIVVCVMTVLMQPPAFAGKVTVAVASNFVLPMQDIVAAFEQDTGHEVTLVSGSTGALYAQIVNGAPFDLLLAADAARPQALVDAGRAAASDRKTYAIGRLVFWTRDAGLSLTDTAVTALEGQPHRLSIANPKLAPYGRAAVEVLDRLGVRAALRRQLVVGQNVNQSYQFVRTGNARFGFVAASLVYRNGVLEQGSAWLVPNTWHAPVRQDAVLLEGADGAPGALFEYLDTASAAAVLKRFGYEVP
ncbi:MAG: molybdate ABC transporter substrate-binding protein [Pseudomonadota bacterium]